MASAEHAAPVTEVFDEHVATLADNFPPQFFLLIDKRSSRGSKAKSDKLTAAGEGARVHTPGSSCTFSLAAPRLRWIPQPSAGEFLESTRRRTPADSSDAIAVHSLRP